jgi:hypothetical protein
MAFASSVESLSLTGPYLVWMGCDDAVQYDMRKMLNKRFVCASEKMLSANLLHS